MGLRSQTMGWQPVLFDVFPFFFSSLPARFPALSCGRPPVPVEEPGGGAGEVVGPVSRLPFCSGPKMEPAKQERGAVAAGS